MNKKGDTNLLFILGILALFGVFSFLYVGIGNTIYELKGENTLPNPETYTNDNPLLPDSTGIFDKVIISIENMPSWVNYVFGLLVFILGLALYKVIVHG